MLLGDPRLPERFWSKILISPTGCWLWTRSCYRDGYASFSWQGRTVAGHLVAYRTLVGRVPDGLRLDHTCRIRHCVNPAHLEPVTQKINILRGVGTSAQHARKLACHLGHAFDVENTRIEIRKDGSVRRICRKCHRDKERTRRAAVRELVAA